MSSFLIELNDPRTQQNLLNVGSSGGAAISVIGITPGGSYYPDGKTFRYGVLIPASEIKACLAECPVDLQIA